MLIVRLLRALAHNVRHLRPAFLHAAHQLELRARAVEVVPLAVGLLGARDLLRLGVIDRIVSEPAGGAHRDPRAAAQALREAVTEELDTLCKMDPAALLRMREDRFLDIGTAKSR